MRSRGQFLSPPTVVIRGALIAAAFCASAPLAATTEAGTTRTWTTEGEVTGAEATIKTLDAAPTTLPANDALAALMEHVKVVRQVKAQITWYSPQFQPYSSYDFRVYPIIGQNDQGQRKIFLQIALKDPPKGQPTSVRAVLDGDPWVVPITESDDIKTYDSGCRTTHAVLLQNQEPFIRSVAAARQAEISLGGYSRAVRFKLTQEDLENFKRILALWEMGALPQVKEEPAAPSPPQGVISAGTSGVTNPEIIRKTRVQPRFPDIARRKKTLGRVVLTAVIRKDGTVGDIKVAKGAGGDCGFEEAAIEAVRQWRYKPGTMDGQPVDVYFTITIEFTYEGYQLAP